MTQVAHTLTTLAETDPTHTVTLRRQFSADMSRRFKALMRDIRVAVVDLDVLGLGADSTTLITFAGKGLPQGVKVAASAHHVAASSGLTLLTPPDPARFTFLRDSAKAQEFMVWLREQEAAGILELVQGPVTGPQPWANTYVRSAYSKGLAGGRANLRAAGMSTLPSFAAQAGALSAVMNQPFHAERLALLYQRTYADLTGITESMNTAINRVLTRGMALGISPEEMARQLNDVIEHTTGAPLPPNHPKGMRGIERARLLARTETVETYNRAALAEYEQAEVVLARRIMVEWETAGDERVRLVHENRSGRVFTMEVASTLIGDPNCRCTLLPVIEGVHDHFPEGI